MGISSPQGARTGRLPRPCGAPRGIGHPLTSAAPEDRGLAIDKDIFLYVSVYC